GQRLPGPWRQPIRRRQSHANSQEQIHRGDVAGGARNRHPSLRARQGQIAKGSEATKVGFGAAIVAAVAATAHWLDAHPVLAIVAAIVVMPLILCAIRTIWRVK